MRIRVSRYWIIVGFLVGPLLGPSPIAAQQLQPPAYDSGGGLFGGYDDLSGVVTVEAQFTAKTSEKPARLFITATMAEGWHIYSITQPEGGPRRTLIKPDASEAYRLTGEFRALSRPQVEPPGIFPVRSETHHASVTWYAPIELAEEVDPAQLQITGNIEAQACKTSCIQPTDYPFTAKLGEGFEIREDAPVPLDIGKLAVQLAFGFLGGLILNLMPCVLPVISLKILAFLEQAGESRARVFMLNAWYAAGILSVFMVLAALAAGVGISGRLAWGEQFTFSWFKIAMTGLVFAMALSFLGVWEIPIPGFAGSGRAGRLQTKEGADGAFFKGVFATILATPCSAPFLGPVFGYLLNQPPYVAYAVFGAVGLGMASPYLLIGAFPKLIGFLPKPGAWMELLRQLMAFPLLGTVVFLFTSINADHFVPTLTLLMGIWFACWWIGRTPPTAAPAQRATAWIGGTLAATLIGIFAFTVMLYESLMPWQPYSPEALAQQRAAGKTVMIEFSADWCATCKVNLKFSIDTQDVRDLIQQNGVVPMLADWSDRSPVITKALNDLGYNSIPVLAIWPADAPDEEVILLPDLVWKSQVLNALKTAGPSKHRDNTDPPAAGLP